MKLLVLFVLLWICSINITNAQESDFHFNTGFIQDITIKNGIVAVIGSQTTIDSVTGKAINHATISIKKNGVWQNLPFILDRNGTTDLIRLSPYSKIQIDSKENIWISAMSGIFKFDGSIWTEYSFSDSLFERNEFSFLFVDKNDNIIVTAKRNSKQGDKKVSIDFLRFANDKFSIIQNLNVKSIFSNPWSLLRGNNFVGLQDGSVILAHQPNFIYDLTKITSNNVVTLHQMISFDNHKGLSEKNVSKIIQHSDGTIWFAHLIGTIFNQENSDSIESNVCCSGVSLTSDLVNFSFLGKDNSFPGDEIPLPTSNIAELPNGDVLITTVFEKFNFHVFDINKRTIKGIDNKNFYKNSKLILSNNHPITIQRYHNYVDTLQMDLKFEQLNNLAFLNLLIDNQSTIYINYSSFLLEIPTKNVTSVQSDVEVSYALRVFPNPAETSIKIDGTKEISSVTATNILGSEVLLNSKGNNSFSITNLSTGLYTLLIQHTDGTTSRTLFVKK